MVADVNVVGTGIIGLSTALELATRGLKVRLIGTTHAGEASSAAGGMLAPSVERELGAADDFAMASRDLYPGFIAYLEEATRFRVPRNSRGILELALDEGRGEELRLRAIAPSLWLGAREVALEEPALAPTLGALLHPLDGSVEPLPLLDALRAAVARSRNVAGVPEDACSIDVGELGCNVFTDRESRLASDYVILAAGAWTSLIAGAGRGAAAVVPVRGQMVAYHSCPVGRVVYGAGGYLIPKSDGHTVAGGTMEHVGFEPVVTEDAISLIRGRAQILCPALARADVDAAWAGLRPVTPDLLPVIGADEVRPRMIYATGHSRNGILLAPATARVVADIVTGVEPRYDISRFQPDRFAS